MKMCVMTLCAAVDEGNIDLFRSRTRLSSVAENIVDRIHQLRI